MSTKHIKYTQEMLDWLRQHRPMLTTKELVAQFNARFDVNIKTSALHSYCKRRGLFTGREGRFGKGGTSWNLGVTMRVSERTEFKPGNRPHNSVSVGTIAWKGRTKNNRYLAQKIAEPNVWEFCHRLAWQAVNGVIPKGSVVIFIDGDRENMAIENLACLTRGALVRLNQMGFSSYPVELRPSLLLLARLKDKAGRRARRVLGAAD
jgi:hypothetical protein